MHYLGATKSIWAALALTPAVALVGCLEAPVIDYTPSPAPGLVELGPAPPPPVVVDGLAVFSGAVKDIVTNGPVAGLSLGSYGITPPAAGETGPDGRFAVDVQAAGELWVYASGPDHTRTYNKITMPAVDYEKDIYALSTADLDAIALAHNVTLNPECGHVVIRTKNIADQNQANVAGLQLIGGGVLHDSRGPYFLDENNQPDPDATYTSSAGKAVFLNICDAGAQALTINDVQVGLDDPEYQAPPAILKVFAGYVTRYQIDVVADPNPPPPPPPPVPYDFPTEIYPVFARNQCGTCHQVGGAAEGTGLYLNDGPENVFDRLVTNPVDPLNVNIADPRASKLLTKPLVEEPPDHPNGAFTSEDHPDYVILYNWIQAGAVYGVNPPPPPVQNVDFYNDVYPIFAARTCTGCHDAANPSGGLALNGGQQQVFDYLQANGLYDVNYPDRGSILRNPYCGEVNCAADPDYPETHPVQVFFDTNDPDYVTIYQWQLQGALYEYVPIDPNVEPDPVNVVFYENVAPRWIALGCTGCHGTDNGQNPQGGLDLQDYPSNAYQQLINAAAFVAQDYAASSIYTKPNAEYPEVNHAGGKAVANAQDNYARYTRSWINEGAILQDPGPIDFAQDVYPIFGTMGCTNCHDANGAGGLALQGDPAVVQQAVDALITADDLENSLIATKGIDLYPNVNHNGGKQAIATYYKEFAYLQWYIREK
jgi:mono/diheme cytochrome c family protein